MLNIEEITSPLGAQMFDFCDSELFQETLQNSEVASSSNCCYEEQSSYPTHISMAADVNKYNNSIDNGVKPAITDAGPTTATAPSTSPSTPTVTPTRNNNLPITFDPSEDQIENDISASIDFTPSPSFSVLNHHQYLNQSNINNNQEPFNISDINQYGHEPPRQEVVPLLGPPISTGYEDECGISSVPSYIRLRATSSPSCTLMDPIIAPYLPSGGMSAPFSAENGGIYSGSGLMLGNDHLSHQELEFQGDNGGIFLPDNMSRVFNGSGELQALSSESQHLVHGGASTTPLASDITSLEDPTFKVGKLSVEERKRKIHRYMKKRNERNFSKKIKYACRKTLADSRPRVRGRFAKNDELGELGRNNGGTNNEYDTDEDISLYSNSMPDHQSKVAVKEEEDLDSSDIFAHISGVNSFKCNYPIQSWI